jgi:Flp pilus assembly protein TadG
MKNRESARKERGFVLLLTVLTMLAVLPIIGMAVDIGMVFLIQTRLSAAIDAAALAGARSFNRGVDLSAQTANAQATALRYFRANFPKGYLGTPMSSPDPTITITIAGAKRTVGVDVTTTASLFFLRYLAFDSAPVHVIGEATRGDVNVILVLDRSGSLAQSGSCDPMKAAAIGFANGFAPGRDNVGLVTFARSATVNFPASMDFKAPANPIVADIISQIVCSGYTFGSGGLAMGYEELMRLNEPGAFNVIVYFTDGMPNVIAADFPVKTQVTSTPASSCDASITTLTGTITQQGSGTEGPFPVLGLITPPRDVADNGGTSLREDMIPLAQRSNCRVTGTSGGNPSGTSTDNPDRVEMDIAYAPSADRWGASLSGHFGSPSTYTSGPYVGKYRVDDSNGLITMALNAVDNLGITIHNDSTLKPLIYSIGLGAMGSQETDLLQRLANDSNASNYDNSKPIGKYINVSDHTALDAAFHQIATDILRLSM